MRDDLGKAVCLLSGGMDSATTLFILKDWGYNIYALTLDYGQNGVEWEIRAAERIAQAAKVKEHRIIKLDLPFLGSALTDPGVDVPLGELYDKIPVTYVPFRNTILLSFGLSYAEQIDAELVAYGANYIDSSGYPDCRPAYIEAMWKVSILGSKRGIEGSPIVIEAPLIDLTKAEIVERAMDLGVPLEKTYSCYLGKEEPCHECDSCRLRDEAIAKYQAKKGIRFNEVQ